MEFEWDENKAESNLEKHGVSFADAETVFGDVLARIFDDEEHSIGERRNGIVGYSSRNRLLIVNFTERTDDYNQDNQRESCNAEGTEEIRK